MKQQQPTEHAEQVAFVQHLKRILKYDKFYAIPNGVNLSDSKQRFAEIEKLKAEGLCVGIPDLCFYEMFLYIEMKRRDGGVTSKEQKKRIKDLKDAGYIVEVCNGVKEAVNVFNERRKYVGTIVWQKIERKR